MSVPKGVITPKEACTLDAAYDQRYKLISKTILCRPDNRSVWFSLEDLRDYLTYAEHQAKEQGYEVDGIRIYMGAYPEVKGEAGYTTVFLVPTTPDSLGKDEMSSADISTVNALNYGGQGNPPGANYPQ